VATISDGIKATRGGTDGADDLRADYDDADGTIFTSGFGNDTLRGGAFDDIFQGGAGNDQMFGGLGADQFRFFGGQASDKNKIEGASDTDFIRDLKFGEGDRIVLGGFGDGKFTKTDTVAAFDNGNDVIIDSYQDLADLAAVDAITLTRNSNGNLLVSITNADGQIQNISITGGVAAFDAATAPAA
jgi:Ca2+-binding RTX toxin-like protein